MSFLTVGFTAVLSIFWMVDFVLTHEVKTTSIVNNKKCFIIYLFCFISLPVLLPYDAIGANA